MTDKFELKSKKAFSGFDIIAALCFLAGLLFLLWKAPFGFAQADENFYLAIPYRLIQGDGLIVHEWNTAQLFAVLLYPAMKLFVAVSGSTEGIFLFFRHVYVASQLLGAVYVYLCLRRIQPVGALLGSLLLMLYAPLHIMSPSYNTLCIILLAAACATVLSCRRCDLRAFLAGLLFAGAVLCCPYLVALYALYSLACLIPALVKRLSLPAISPAFWLRFTGGCAALAAVFAVFILSRASVGEILTALPSVFADTESLHNSFFFHLFKYAEALYGNFWITWYSLSWPILALVMALDKRRMEHRELYIIPAMLITAGYFAYYVFADRTVNYLMFPMNILGGFAFFLCRERDVRPFVFLFIPGIVYSLCVHFASNLGLMSIASAMSISGIASVVYICTLAKELLSEKPFSRLVALGLLLAVLMQLGVLCWFRSRYTMWDEDSGNLSVTIESGPQKGIVTTAEKAARYESLMAECLPVRQSGAGTVLYLYTDNWLYLMDEARMACFSPWVSYLYPETDMARLESYWQLYPEKRPDIIFIGDKEKKLELLKTILPGTWEVTETASGCILSP